MPAECLRAVKHRTVGHLQLLVQRSVRPVSHVGDDAIESFGSRVLAKGDQELIVVTVEFQRGDGCAGAEVEMRPAGLGVLVGRHGHLLPLREPIVAGHRDRPFADGIRFPVTDPCHMRLRHAIRQCDQRHDRGCRRQTIAHDQHAASFVDRPQGSQNVGHTVLDPVAKLTLAGRRYAARPAPVRMPVHARTVDDNVGQFVR